MKKKMYLTGCFVSILTLFSTTANAQLSQTIDEVHYGTGLGCENKDGFLRLLATPPYLNTLTTEICPMPNTTSISALELRTVNDASPIAIGGNNVFFIRDGFAGVFNDVEASGNPISGNYSKVFVPGQLRIGTIYTGWDNWKFRVETDPSNAPFINGMLIVQKNPNSNSYGSLTQVSHPQTKAIVVENMTIAGANKETMKVMGDGHVYCTEVDVMLAGTFPDYVFEPAYPLMSIRDLEKFVKTEKHLPGVPSEKEVKEKGSISLGEMQKTLLEKVEELTLYVIELQKQIDELKK